MEFEQFCKEFKVVLSTEEAFLTVAKSYDDMPFYLI
jgi:hypothetical protein